MNVLVTGFTPGKKIVAIKGIRQVTALSLKDSKDVADAVEAGTSTKISVANGFAARLEEHGVTWQAIPVAYSLADLVDALDRFPRDKTIGEILDVLSVAVAFREEKAT